MPMVKPSWQWNNDKKVQECIRTGQTSYSLNLLNYFIFYTICNTAFDDVKDGSQLRYKLYAEVLLRSCCKLFLLQVCDTEVYDRINENSGD